MNRASRIVLILYCGMILYCCLWVPWHLVQSPATEGFHEWRTGYGWLWSGPSSASGEGGAYSSPDLTIIALRLIAASTIAGAGYIAANCR
jgi:hypothetical protein